MVIQGFSKWAKFILLPYLASILLRLIHLTMRIERIDFDLAEEFYKKGRNAIFAFWHGRQLMMPFAPYDRKRAVVLVSLHRDGELMSRTISHLGIRSIRGSTTRGGLRAALQLIRLAKTKSDLWITPDGPKGPVFRVNPGVIILAKKTGLPIFPITFSASKKKSSRAGIDS